MDYLAGNILRAVLIIDIGVRAFHGRDETGPLWPKEPQALNAGIFTAHLEDLHVINFDAISLAFALRQHPDLILPAGKPPGHQRGLPFHLANMATTTPGHRAMRKMSYKANPRLCINVFCPNPISMQHQP